MLDDGFAEDFVELGSFDFEATGGVDFGGELEEFGDILTGFAAGNKNGGVGEEVEVMFELVEDFIGVVDQVGFGEDDNDSLTSFDNLPGESLVELRMGFGGINEQSADVGLFDGGKGAQGGEFFDANFAFAGLA